MIKSGQVWTGIFECLDATGALATPGAGPTGTLYVNGVSNAAPVTISAAKPFKFSVTLPSLSPGDRVDMYIAATISSIATAGIVASEQADTFHSSDIVSKVDTVDTVVDQILTDTGTDGVVLATNQPAITWAEQKIIADAMGPALEITNNNMFGMGLLISTLMPHMAVLPMWATQELLQATATIVNDLHDTDIPAIKSDTANDFFMLVDVLNYLKDGGSIDTLLDAIKAKTDNLPASPAPANEYDARMTAIQSDLDNPDQYKADLSALATTAHLQDVENKLDVVDGVADDILAEFSGLGTDEDIAAAVRAALTAELAMLDVAVSTRLASASYEVPANTDIASIKSVAEKVETTLEADGEVFRFTGDALANAPSADVSSLVESMSNLPGAIYDELSRIPSISFNMPEAGEIVAYAGDSVDFQISGLGSLQDAEKIYFCAKLRKTDPDTSSMILIEQTVGLIRINATAGTPANGSITVLDAEAGNIKVRLDPVESVKIPEATYFCDVKIINSEGEAITKTQGEILFYYDITKAVS